jgi:hypothetical protein
MGGWQVEDLVSHLRRKGLEFRAMPTAEHCPLNRGAYLTTTDQPWERLNGLLKNPDAIDEWEGTVFCVRATQAPEDEDPRLEMWGDCGLRLGPFLFFGDRQLLARIRDALADLGVEAAPRRREPGQRR